MAKVKEVLLTVKFVEHEKSQKYEESLKKLRSAIAELSDGMISSTSLKTSELPMASQSVFSEEKNPRGIPKSRYVVRISTNSSTPIPAYHSQENIESYIGGSDADVEGPLKRFQDALAYVMFRYFSAPPG